MKSSPRTDRPPEADVKPVAPRRIAGFDTLRLALAVIVVFCHLGFVLPLPDPDQLTGIARYAVAVFSNSFNGPAAVVCFFVISGFCIHYPFRHQERLALLPYFSRRHIRIWVPIVAAVWIASQLDVKLVVLGDSILWSLIAEEIYYLIYPAIRRTAQRWSWSALLVPAYVGAVAIVLTDPAALDYPMYGIRGNWILGLPAWLLGCMLAQNVDRIVAADRHTGYVEIWAWRLGMLLLGTACSVARFHASIGYPWSLTMASPVVYFWLQREIQFYLKHPPRRFLEQAGMATYSVYLVHMISSGGWVYCFGGTPRLMGERLLYFSWIAATITAFYLLIERPSHRLARASGRWVEGLLSGKKSVAEPQAAPVVSAESATSESAARRSAA